MKIIGLIPARKNSKRIPGKNLAMVGDKSLLQRAIDTARRAEVFDKILVSSDWHNCLNLAAANDCVIRKRPDEISQDHSHDYEWVKDALHSVRDYKPGFDIFVILRPTSPFRTEATIIRALNQFVAQQPADSMRAVEPTPAHPLKSWELEADGTMIPHLDVEDLTVGVSAYDLPTQTFPEVFIQNACIHIAWTKTVEDFKNVSGNRILPFFTRGREGIDINTPEDIAYAEWQMLQWAPEDKELPPYLFNQLA